MYKLLYARNMDDYIIEDEDLHVGNSCSHQKNYCRLRNIGREPNNQKILYFDAANKFHFSRSILVRLG